MYFTVNAAQAFASTGGRAHQVARPALVFIHGSGQNRLTWTQQVRKFAYGGYNVLAVDLPGHGNSDGPALTSIAQSADWLLAAMDAVDFARATLVGHSQGVLSALELAARAPSRVERLVLVAGAMAIPVNEALVDWSQNKTARAYGAMTGWGFGPLGHRHDNTVPGHSHLGAGAALMAMNAPGALHADLNACNAYSDGPEAAAAVQCPALVVLGAKDKMTPLKQGRKMLAALPNARGVELADTGHMIPSERPAALNTAIADFLAKTVKR